MAKVKIQGHASGTGVLTVTAPNTSTDRTITLPDGTGTLIADDGSGNLGIGTASPSAATGFNAPAFEVSGSDPSIILSKTGADSIALVNHASHLKILNDTDDRAIAHIHQDAPANTLIVQSDGSLLVGTTDGGSSGAGDIVASAIFLGGNQAANELDDYEEGTWTPNFVATGLSVSYNTQVGKYTKIGNAVICTLEINTSDISGDGTNNQLKITGIPFTPVTNSGGFAFGGTYGFDEAPAVAQFSGSDILLIDPSGNWSVANDLSDGNDKNHTYSCFVFTTAS